MNQYGFSLKHKILIFTMLPFVAAMAFVTYMAIQSKATYEKDLIVSKVQEYGTFLESGDASFESVDDTAKMEAFFDERIISVGIFDRSGEMIYGSSDSSHGHEEESDAAPIGRAYEGYISVVNREEAGQPIIAAYYPIVVNTRVIGVFAVEFLLEEINARIWAYAMFILTMDAIGIAVGYASIVILTNRYIISRLKRLTAGLAAIGQGDLEHSVELSSGDEIGLMSQSFEKMRSEIRQSRQSLERYSVELERQVEAKTKELNDKVNDLERMNRLMVGRELKMVELKQEIAKLKGQ